MLPPLHRPCPTEVCLLLPYPPDDVPSSCLTVSMKLGRGTWSAISLSGLLPLHPAYLIYTSGSTGQPKGVLTTQAASAIAYCGCKSNTLSPLRIASLQTLTPLMSRCGSFFWPDSVELAWGHGSSRRPSGATILFSHHQKADHHPTFRPSHAHHLLTGTLGLLLHLAASAAVQRRSSQHADDATLLAHLAGCPTAQPVRSNGSGHHVISRDCLLSRTTRLLIGRPIANTRIEILNPHS